MDNLLKSEILESIPPNPTPPSGSGNIVGYVGYCGYESTFFPHRALKDIYPGGGAKGGLGTTAEGKT